MRINGDKPKGKNTMKKKSEKKKKEQEVATLGFELAPQLRPVQKENLHAIWGHKGTQGTQGTQGAQRTQGNKEATPLLKSINSSEVLTRSSQICDRMHH